ncbi:hypothetical protein A0U90_00710 [Kozakia baliensis]|nr:hypothetical protein A0U90_00710 [Kozakia baliensis]
MLKVNVTLFPRPARFLASCMVAASLTGLSACASQNAPQDPFFVRNSSQANFMPSVSSAHNYRPSTSNLTSSLVAYHEPATPSYPDRPLNENLSASLEMADYVRALKDVGLFPVLMRPGPYTVFAIPNGPLENYAKQWPTGPRSPADQAQLRHVLAYTIVPGKWDEAALRAQIAKQHGAAVSLYTLADVPLVVRLEPQTGELTLSNVAGQTNRLWMTGIPQSNGVLYFTQNLLSPQG